MIFYATLTILSQLCFGLDVKNINNSAHSPCDSERQKATLEEMKTKTKLMIQERKMKIGEVQRAAELSRKSADQQILDSERAFSALIQSAQRSLARVAEEIKERQRRTQREADMIIQELKQEVSELSKRQAELNDNLDYNQSFSFKNWTEVTVPQPSYEETVTTSMNALKETLAQETRTLLRRAELNRIKQFMVDVTLDQNTAHPSLVLSKDRKQVYCGNINQNLPDNPERFDTAPNVLGKQSFSSGRFYFEVQVEGKISWDVGVVHESISRKGSINARPDDGYWAICLRRGEQYKASGVRLTLLSPLNRLGVFVDCEKGLISFYDADSAEIIHKFTDLLFKEKLYPFFSPSINHGGLNTAPLVL